MTSPTPRLQQLQKQPKEESPNNAYNGEILCNRALNMGKIKAIGFDMDYTLAMYHTQTFESLSATSALHKLVHDLGYPADLLHLKYDHSKYIRGLVIDKQHGNILKLDRHKYVKRAFHGNSPLSKQQRREMYDNITQSGGGFQEPRFAVLDAMFALPDAFLFSSIMDYKDNFAGSIKQDYNTIYDDVRRSVDICHRDGSIKDQVAKDPGKYIQRDAELVVTLRKLKESGQQVFLLTNSLWAYTDVVMQYVLGTEWIELFDIIITGSCKPAFMLNRRLPIYRCEPVSGKLSITEGIYGSETAQSYLQRGKCFHGGNYSNLHELLRISSGTEILYVGDHIFSDVLRSKRTLGWRTMLIIPELEEEVNVMYASETVALQGRIRDASAALRQMVRGDAQAVDAAKTELAELIEAYHQRFHTVWGQLFKTGLMNSRFATQVENYACLYTSRVSNMAVSGRDVEWTPIGDVMPHDRLM